MADDEAPFSALAFKIATDPFVGTLTFFRVYSGVLNSGDTVYNPVKGKRERIGRILQMHANDREEIKEVRAGDIAAAVGLKDVTTGDTLCDPDEQSSRSSAWSSRSPVISVAVEPKTKADQEKMGIALGKLAQEDPSFRVHTDEESGQTIISGMGELHLDIIVDRMKREFKVEANVGKPQVAYRETIRKAVEAGRQVRPPVRRPRPVRPRLAARSSRTRAGKGYEFVERDRRRRGAQGIHPGGRQGHPGADEERCAGRLPGRRRQGHPVRRLVPRSGLQRNGVQDRRLDGLQGRRRKASPVLLEPMMEVEVVTPEDYMGDVMGDLNRRRGMLQGIEDGPSGKIINAQVPLAEMFGYATDLRSRPRVARPTPWNSIITPKRRTASPNK